MLRAARIAAAILGLATYAESVAFAQTLNGDPVSLSWLAPEGSGCPDASYVLAELRRNVGAASTAKQRSTISASATISANAGGFRLQLTTTEGRTSGERAFQDESCRALADAAVVILAWMVAPEAMAARSAPAELTHQPAPTTATAEDAVTPPPSPATASAAPYAGLGSAADVGTMPNPALAAAGHVGVDFQTIRLEARGAYWPRRRKSVEALPSGVVPGATFSLWNIGVQACWEAVARPSRAGFRLALCLGPELDVLNGAGFGVSSPTEATAAWVSLAGTVAGRVALAPSVALFAFVGGALPTQRQRFALRGVGEIYRPSVVAGRGSLGLELELWLGSR